MNKLFFIVLFCSQFLFSQKVYHFDYALEFDNSIKIYKTDSTSVFLVNSKSNNYMLFLINKDSLNYNLDFVDQEGNSIQSKIDKKDFNKAETISNNCSHVTGFHNPYKYQIKNHKFVNYKDTIINNVLYFHYAFKCTKNKKFQERKGIVTTHFIIDKNSNFFTPFLLRATMYEEYKLERNIPNGIPFITYEVDVNGEIVKKMQLINKIKIDKKFTIPSECDRTQS
jgi:hypothetical protein